MKKRNLVLPLFVVTIMISSTLGFMSGDSYDSEQYGDYTFTKVNSGWVTYIEGKQYLFEYLPSDLEDMDYNLDSVDLTDLYIAYNPAELNDDMNYAISKLRNFLAYRGEFSQIACLDEENCPDIPVVSCEGDNVIGFINGEEKIYKDDKCTYVSGEFIKSVNRICYDILGVM